MNSPAPPSALDCLLAPRSIALVGASTRPNSPGHSLVAMARQAGYRGALYPVNPGYREVEGLACYPALSDLPEPPEQVALALANDRLEAALAAAIEAGAKAATVFATCQIPSEPPPRLAERLAAMAREAGLAVCGGNCMGFYNLAAGLRVCAYPSPLDMTPGGIAFISQSGSVFGALAHNDRRLAFNLCVSSGNEMVTTAADYLAWAVHQPETRVAGLFLETVRDPTGFEAALQAAAARDIPVVVLKVGRSAAAAAMALSHTGALAGNDAAYEALFRQYGVLRVRSEDELAATLLLLQEGWRAGPGGLASIHDSGGERELVVDLAEEAGVPFAEIGQATKATLAANLDPGLEPMNPLDAWGTGRDFEAQFTACMKALLADPGTAALVHFNDLRDGYYLSQAHVRILSALRAETDKPLALASNYGLVRHRDLALQLTRAGVPVIDGTEEALKAIRHLFAYRDFRTLDAAPPPAPDPALSARWRARLSAAAPLDEAEALTLLADYGLPVVAHASAASEAEALAAAEGIGYPLALKTAAPGILHKSDRGGVRLGLADDAALRAAYGEMAARLGPRVLLSAMAPAGTEIALGALFDPQFGPCLMLAAGGTLVELLADRVFARAPVNACQAGALIAELRVARLLAGHRGKPPADTALLARAVERFSVMIHDLGDRLAECDVNPIIAGPGGALAVDALVIPRQE